MGMSNEPCRASRENLLVVLAVGLFAAGLCFIPPTLLESSDYLVLWKPSFQFLKDAIREGRVPLWNPYLHLGRPYVADMANMAFYLPTHLICLGEATGFFLQVWLHCLLAVFGMRKLAGVLLVGRWQSYLMAFTFMASGALTARWAAGQLPNCWAICYVPWLFYYAARTAEPWAGRRLAWYAVLLALQLLCHPQVFWFSAIGQAVFIVVRAVRLPVRKMLQEVARGLCQFGAACVWCAGLLAVVLMPFLELVKESNRSENTPAFANSFNLDCTDLLSLLGPLQSGAVWETNFFVGTLVVVLGMAGLCLVRERNVRGLLGVLVMGFLIALGDKTPCFGLFYKWLPGFAGFRFHSRAAVLVVVALICAAGIWLSRPHPRLRAVWTYLFGVPARWALVLLVLLQSLDLLQGTGMVAGVITRSCCIAVRTPLERSFEQAFVTQLRKADLIKRFLPPPRVSVRPSFVPAGYGMIHHYSHFDAGCALSLRRPWDYLHAVLGLVPNPGKGELPSEVYNLGPFPYPDLNLSAGVDPRACTVVLATNPAPRAFLVYAAEVVGDYGTILNRLARGHDIHRRALLESPLAQPLPQEAALLGPAAVIRRFEPNWLLVEVEAKTNALLVLAEAWHPGWRAEIDGRAAACVPANIWMRAVPVPAGRHLVRLYFRQNYLFPGFLISLASIGLLLVPVAKPGPWRTQPTNTVCNACWRPRLLWAGAPAWNNHQNFSAATRVLVQGVARWFVLWRRAWCWRLSGSWQRRKFGRCGGFRPCDRKLKLWPTAGWPRQCSCNAR